MTSSNLWYASGAASTAPPIRYPIGNCLRWKEPSYMRKQYTSAFMDGYAPQLGSGNISFWTKRGAVNASDATLYVGTCSQDEYKHSKLVDVYNDTTGGYYYYREDNNGGNYRVTDIDGKAGDPSGWYHILISWDHANNSKNFTLYINGVERINMAPRLDEVRFAGDSNCDDSILQIGGQTNTNSHWFSGFLADFYCVASDDPVSGRFPPDRFAFYNEQGIWQPTDPEFTYEEYGKTGFHLTFDPSQDSDPLVGVGIDSSGRDNHWEAFGFQLDDPESWSYDSFPDSPTDNQQCYNNMFPAQCDPNTNNEYANKMEQGVLRFKVDTSLSQTGSGSGIMQNATTCLQPSPGSKLFYQYNIQPSAESNYPMKIGIGFCPVPVVDPINTYPTGIAFNFVCNEDNASATTRKTWQQINNPDLQTPVIQWPQLDGEPTDVGGEIPTLVDTEENGGLWCGVFYEQTTGDIWFLTNNHNGQWSADNWDPKILKPDGTYVDYNGTLPDDCKFNFPDAYIWTYRCTASPGQGTGRRINGGGFRAIQSANAWETFEGSLPNGFEFATTVNSLPKMPILNGTEHHKPVAYTGTGADQTIDVGFAPDLVIIKRYSNNGGSHGGGWWLCFDTIRGPGKTVSMNKNNKELFGDTNRVTSLTAFTDNGFTLGVDNADAKDYNQDGQQYIALCWKGGGTAVTNNEGSTSSQVSANPEAGFSIVKYTGNGETAATIGHGLDKKPEMIWIKNLTNSTFWAVYSNTISTDQHLTFETDNFHLTQNSGLWNDTEPTDSVFTVSVPGDGYDNMVNQDGDEFIAYCWTGIPGYSKFGGYFGTNKNNGPYPLTNFAVQTVFMTLLANQSYSHWYEFDKGVYPYNNNEGCMNLDTDATLQTNYEKASLYANGFKLITDDSGFSKKGSNYLFASWGLYPYGGSNCYGATGQ